MYDIHLNKNLTTPSEIYDFFQDVPILADPAFQRRLFPPSTAPGPLGLELPRDLAKRLLEHFVACGSNGYCFPAAYHHPRLTIEQATTIAAQEIEKRRMERDPTDLFHKRNMLERHPMGMEEKPGETELTADVLDAIFQSNSTYPCFWSFGAVSERMTKERGIPGAIFVAIDKLDGHIWQPDELRRLWKGRLFDE